MTSSETSDRAVHDASTVGDAPQAHETATDPRHDSGDDTEAPGAGQTDAVAVDDVAAAPPEPENRRAEVLQAIHHLAGQHRTGMMLHVDDRAPQPVDRARATQLFSLMIDRVKENGSVPAHLTWNGVPIAVHRSAGERLQILVGPAEAQVDIPLRHAWPPDAERGDLLGKLVSYISTSGERSQAARQNPPTSPAAVLETAKAASSPARHAFPGPPAGNERGAASPAATWKPDAARPAAAPMHRR